MAQVKDRYAQALFEITKEKNSFTDDLEQAELVEATLKIDYVQDFLMHPGISQPAKIQFLENTYGDTLSDHMISFLFLMLQKRREEHIVPALHKYIELVYRQIGRVKARVVSATPLSSEQIKSIEKMMSEELEVTVTAETEIDPSVIGGFYILAEGRIFDGTVRTQLNKMKNVIYKGSTKAKVVSATTLSETQLENIRNTLAAKVDMQVDLRYEVDPNVIGGFYVLVDGRVFDGTVKSELKSIKKQMQRGNIDGKQARRNN
ncbi:MAG: ATP synthase F1 subunit delta [Eubacteriales bacterium]|nr:ATP synthase F1 subunit delta [Eubacteriales bacterium]MDD4324057.1 ATP synthase F1 subunit delta [Eubacteriales bacterium]MDD4542085.1 ATP synthase F1 subunit delta [Eubacteriales bacterium]